MDRLKVNKVSLSAFGLAFLGTLSAVLLIPHSRDYIIYMEMFESYSGAPTIIDSVQTLELIYSIVAYLTKNFLVTVFCMGIVALTVKLVFFSKYREIAIIAGIYYFSRFFFVHDATQIRISFGIAMLIVSFNVLQNRKIWQGCFYAFLAVAAHTSTLVYVPIIFFAALVKHPLKSLKRQIKVTIFIVPVILIAANIILNVIPFETLLTNLPDSRLAIYSLEDYDYVIPSLYTDVFFYLKLLALFSLIFWRSSSEEDELNNEVYVRFGIIFMFSLAFFVLLHDLYAIAARFADIAAPFECIVVAVFLTRLSKPTQSFFTPFASLLVRIVVVSIIAGRLLLAQTYLFDGSV